MPIFIHNVRKARMLMSFRKTSTMMNRYILNPSLPQTFWTQIEYEIILKNDDTRLSSLLESQPKLKKGTYMVPLGRLNTLGEALRRSSPGLQ